MPTMLGIGQRRRMADAVDLDDLDARAAPLHLFDGRLEQHVGLLCRAARSTGQRMRSQSGQMWKSARCISFSGSTMSGIVGERITTAVDLLETMARQVRPLRVAELAERRVDLADVALRVAQAKANGAG